MTPYEPLFARKMEKAEDIARRYRDTLGNPGKMSDSSPNDRSHRPSGARAVPSSTPMILRISPGAMAESGLTLTTGVESAPSTR